VEARDHCPTDDEHLEVEEEKGKGDDAELSSKKSKKATAKEGTKQTVRAVHWVNRLDPCVVRIAQCLDGLVQRVHWQFSVLINLYVTMHLLLSPHSLPMHGVMTAH
jgi:hypothetical protein